MLYPSDKFILSKLSITSPQYGNLELKSLSPHARVPSLFTSEPVNALSLQSSGAFGSLFFHEIRYDNFSIRQNRFNIGVNMDLSTVIETQSLAFHFILKNPLRFVINGYPEAYIERDHYTVVYVPRVDWQYRFDHAQDYTCFSIHYIPEYLLQCLAAYPVLPDFLMKTVNRLPGFVNNVYAAATPEILDVISHILNCHLSGNEKYQYLNLKVQELLLLCILNMQNDNFQAEETVLTEVEVEKLVEIRGHLVKHPERNHTMKELERMTGLNEFKIKKGVQQLYNSTVHGIVTEERMQKAKKLLMETDMAVSDIATCVGYRNHSNFANAFKKRFYYSPMAMRSNFKDRQ